MIISGYEVGEYTGKEPLVEDIQIYAALNRGIRIAEETIERLEVEQQRAFTKDYQLRIWRELGCAYNQLNRFQKQRIKMEHMFKPEESNHTQQNFVGGKK